MHVKINDLRVGTILKVQAYKFNGLLYRQWNQAKIIYNNEKHIVLILYKTKVTELNGAGWVYKEPVIWFMPKKQNFNCLILIKKNGFYRYINLASTPIFEDDTIKFIDYDLDVKCYPQKELKIVDRDEFNTNGKIMKYPDVLKNKILDELSNVIKMYNNFQYFFSDDIIKYYLKMAENDKIMLNIKNYLTPVIKNKTINLNNKIYQKSNNKKTYNKKTKFINFTVRNA